ncbi:MAG TPA: translocation/assembly module TamB domain-containing protein [Thermodesulfobacteriota bacterium]|nr:translocation/assembly module TamB domain-containing protein [Thermodesulfobacteriota bacterium]
MKKWLKYGSIGFALLLGIAFATGWLLTTPAGARWLLGAISHWASVEIDARKITGRFFDELRLEGLKIRWPEGLIEIDRLQVRWQPANLLAGRIVLSDLDVGRMEIKDGRPQTNAPPDLTLPRIQLLPAWLQLEAKSFRLKELIYRRLDGDPFMAEDVSTQLLLSQSTVKLKNMSFKTSYGLGEGRGEIQFLKPALHLDLSFTPKEAVLGLNHLSIGLRLLRSRHPEQMAGTMAFTGGLASGEKVEAKGEVGLNSNQIRMSRVLLLEPGRPGTVTFDGQVSFIPDQPLISLQLKMEEIDLSKDLVLKTKISGDLWVEGNPSHFKGNFKIENSDESWRVARLSGSFQGNRQGVIVSALDGALLNGTLKGQLGVSWSKGFSLRGNLQGRDLDPSRITQDWPGRINMNIDGHLQWPESMPLEGKLEAFLLDSHLRGKALTGRINAQVDQGMLQLKRADLHGNGFDLSVQGELKNRLDFEARVSDLSGLIPGAQGSFNGKGWVRWQEHLWAGLLSGQGKNVSIRQFKAASMDVTARLDEEARGGIDLKTKAAKVVVGSIQADSVSLDMKGLLRDHTLEVVIRWPEGDAQGAFAGGYTKEAWKGTITRLTGDYPRGRAWSMTSPVTLSLSTSRLSLTPFVVTSGTGERVRVRADLALKPISGILEAEWEQFDLARLHLRLTKPLLLGQTTGKLKTEWLGENRIRLHAGIDMAGSVQDPSLKLGQIRGMVNLDWTEKGLDLSYGAELVDGGTFHGQLLSPESGRFALPEQLKIKAFWKAVDLDLLKDWLPQDLTLKGQASGRLSGQWSKGRAWITAGEIKVSQGMVRWKTREGPIQSALRNADLNWSWHDDDLQGNLTFTLANYGEIKGRFQLPLTGQWPLAFQKTGPVSLSLKAQVEERGLLSILLPKWVKESRGAIDLNLNANGTWEKPQIEGSLRLKKLGIQVLAASSFLSPSDKKTVDSINIESPRGLVSLNWDEKGLLALYEMELAEGGRLQGQLTSPQPAHLAPPERGTLSAVAEGIRLNSLRPWIPPAFDADGFLSGKFDGEWDAGSRFKMKGDLKVSGGNLNWRREDGQISAKLKEGDLHLDWDNETLRGDLSMVLEKYGHARGNFRVPLPARLPLASPVDGPIHFLLQGQFMEMGLLASLFPGVIQESRGQLDLNLAVNGTLKRPKPEGHLRFEKAGAYLPAAGIRLEDFGLEAKFSEEQVQIVSFRVRSGPGHIEGAATFSVKDRRISRFQGMLRGDRFQMIYLPELQVLCTPRLELDGTLERLKVRGEIQLPEFSLSGLQTRGLIRPSPDVIIVDKKEVPKSDSAFPLDAELRVILGEKVFVRTGGIDARLAGGFTLRVEPSRAMKADGEIQVAQGHYTFYGQKLDITRGRLIFSGPIDNPSLDVLALRKIKGATRWEEQLQEVQAGVVVTGNIQSPMVRLYSQPILPEKDVLSYIVFGQPVIKGNQSQTASLMQAAGALLSAGESVLLKNQLSSQMGIDSLDIRTTTIGSPGSTESPGSAGSGELSRSIVTVGKYLDPRLYVGIGGSPFTKAYQIILRYSLTKHLEVETKGGTESGANLYYKIEFD